MTARDPLGVTHARGIQRVRRKRLEPVWAHANTTQPVLGMSDFHMFLKSDTSPLGAISLGGDTLEQLPDLGDTFENSMPELVMPAEEDLRYGI